MTSLKPQWMRSRSDCERSRIDYSPSQLKTQHEKASGMEEHRQENSGLLITVGAEIVDTYFYNAVSLVILELAPWTSL